MAKSPQDPTSAWANPPLPPTGLISLNGFTVFAANRSKDTGRFLILGARSQVAYPSGFEYVTAWMNRADDGAWDWGHYFGDLNEAVKDFEARWKSATD